MGSLVMTMIWAACTIMVIIMAIKTIEMTRKIKRIQKYLDLKGTREKQEDDDQLWKEKIAAGNKLTRPNPRRNYEQMNKYKEDLQEKIYAIVQDQKHQDQKQDMAMNYLNECIKALNRQQEGKASENIPLLYQ